MHVFLSRVACLQIASRQAVFRACGFVNLRIGNEAGHRANRAESRSIHGDFVGRCGSQLARVVGEGSDCVFCIQTAAIGMHGGRQFSIAAVKDVFVGVQIRVRRCGDGFHAIQRLTVRVGFQTWFRRAESRCTWHLRFSRSVLTWRTKRILLKAGKLNARLFLQSRFVVKRFFERHCVSSIATLRRGHRVR